MIQAETLAFLKKLDKNNHKEWFDKNRNEYEAAKKNILEFTQQLLQEMIAFEPALQGIAAKDCVFRIFRDVRFSKNKAPYKNNFGCYIAPGGKKSTKAGYYVHIQPNGQSFLAGGMYMPEANVLNNIRQEIDYNTAEFKKIIESKNFKKTFGNIQGEQLKNPPKGYDKDHPEIALLKFKSYTAWHKLSDEQVIDKKYLKTCIQVFKELQPFNQFLNRAVE
jgi:uncharacterized protein (TIGR02453 family)